MRLSSFLAATLMILLITRVSFAQTRLIDSLKHAVEQRNADSNEVINYLKLTNEFTRINMATAKQYAVSSMVLAKKLNLLNKLSSAYSLMATLFSQSNKTDSALYYIGLLKKLSDESHSIFIATNYNFTAGLLYRHLANFRESMPYMKEALRLYEQQKSKIGIAGQNLNIGNNYIDMGQYRAAISYHLAALKLFEELGNKRGISFCYAAIGSDFIKLDQYREALLYVNRSMALKKELDDKKGLATAYASLGDIEQHLANPGKALDSYLAAVAINQELKLTGEEAKAYMAIGGLYADQKDEVNARAYLGRSAALFKQADDTTDVAGVNAQLANLEKTKKDQQHSENIFLNTLKTAIKVGDKNTEVDNYEYLADFYERNKKFDKALEYRKKYETESDSLQNSKLQLQVRDLEQHYNAEKQEKEIVLLKKDQQLYRVTLQEQKIFRYSALLFLLMLLTMGFLVMARYRAVQKAKRLLEMEQMRNSIARNLHDDIGSSLSSINILSEVALRQADGNTQIWGNLEKIKKNSYAIMESMTDIVWAINPANDPLEITILKMKEFAVNILEPAGVGFEFNYEGKLTDLKLGVDERKNLYLIFKEAINNIAKYSGATFISIALQRTAQEFLMKISDNGNGFDSTKPYSGNGLKNMQSRALEMNAVFKINSSPATGTEINVVFPIT